MIPMIPMTPIPYHLASEAWHRNGTHFPVDSWI